MSILYLMTRYQPPGPNIITLCPRCLIAKRCMCMARRMDTMRYNTAYYESLLCLHASNFLDLILRLLFNLILIIRSFIFQIGGQSAILSDLSIDLLLQTHRIKIRIINTVQKRLMKSNNMIGIKI